MNTQRLITPQEGIEGQPQSNKPQGDVLSTLGQPQSPDLSPLSSPSSDKGAIESARTLPALATLEQALEQGREHNPRNVVYGLQASVSQAASGVVKQRNHNTPPSVSRPTPVQRITPLPPSQPTRQRSKGTFFTEYPGLTVMGAIGGTVLIITVAGLKARDEFSLTTASSPSVTISTSITSPASPTIRSNPTASTPIVPSTEQNTSPKLTPELVPSSLPTTTLSTYPENTPATPPTQESVNKNPQTLESLTAFFKQQGLHFSPVTAEQFPVNNLGVPEAMQLIRSQKNPKILTWKSYRSEEKFNSPELQGLPPIVVVLAEPNTDFFYKVPNDNYQKHKITDDSLWGKIISISQGNQEIVYLQRSAMTPAEFEAANMYKKARDEAKYYGFMNDTIEYPFGTKIERVTVPVVVPTTLKK